MDIRQNFQPRNCRRWVRGRDASDKAAITAAGVVNLRRVEASGFGTVVRSLAKGGEDLPASAAGATFVVRYDQGRVFGVEDNKSRIAELAIEEFPAVIPPRDAKWVDGGKSGESLQKAIDSGAEWIYLRPGPSICMDETLIVRGRVRRIQGLSAHLIRPKGKPCVRIENGTSPVVLFDNVYIESGIEQASSRTLAFRHGEVDSKGVKATGRGGSTHIMDVIGRGYEIGNGHNFWGRQVNSEFGEAPLFVNSGNSWILGFKMETSPRGSKDAPNSTPSLVNRSGNLEVLGGLLYTLGNNRDNAPLVPAFTNERGRLSVSFRLNGRPETLYNTLLRQGPYEGGKDIDRPTIMQGAPGLALLVDER
jgi:hypothetical protein